MLRLRLHGASLSVLSAVFLIGGCVTIYDNGASPTAPPGVTPTMPPTMPTTAPPGVTPTAPPVVTPTAPPVVTPTAPPTPAPTSQRTPRPTRTPAPTRTPTPVARPTLDPYAAATYGSLDLGAGFLLDPYPTSITSGGPVDVSYLGFDCFGFAAVRRDLAVNYSAGGAQRLRFYFEASGDTMLIVNDADGNWHCNDDSFATNDPSIDFINPSSGRYDVWVGSVHGDESFSGTLYITEIETNHPR